ncbi:MAG: hypothetical protein IJR27_06610 [Synergistaceae bacterium]|nr:hypothetical protein [Synergistaceae bacterium]MBQ9574931.1 hypothetical protein [Synergistaceae bacterium]
MREICIALLTVLIFTGTAFSTTFSGVKSKCSVCGTENEFSVLSSTNAFGPSDLDLRPPEMKRSTMPMWVQECSNCGYAASDIKDPLGTSPEFLKSEGYISCEGTAFKSRLAARFYRQYMIARKCDDPMTAFNAALHAAWSCDDADDYEGAKICREKAAVLAEKLIADERLNESGRESITLMRADILRRAGHFEEVIRGYSNVKFSGKTGNNYEVMNKVVKFEVEKAKERDVKCYTVSDVLGK